MFRNLALMMIVVLLACPIAIAENQDPTEAVWEEPTRLEINDFDSAILKSSEICAGSEKLIAFHDDGSNVIVSDLGQLGTVSNVIESLKILDEFNPRCLNYNNGILLSTISSGQNFQTLNLRYTSDFENWFTMAQIDLLNSFNLGDYSIAVSEEEKIDVFWSESNGEYNYLMHYENDGYNEHIGEIELELPSLMTTHHSPTTTYIGDSLYLAWITNMFDQYNFPGEHDEVQVVYSVYDGQWREPVPVSQAFAVDKNPSFVTNSDEPILLFSSDRAYEPRFESEKNSFHNIWFANLLNPGSVNQLPEWNLNEDNPSATYFGDSLVAVWHDGSGPIISHTKHKLTMDFLSNIDYSLSLSTENIQVIMSEDLRVGEITIKNDGQLIVSGQLIPSENLVLEINEFTLLPGEEITTWINHGQLESGTYHEGIEIQYNGDKKYVPVTIERRSQDVLDDNIIEEGGYLSDTTNSTDKLMTSVVIFLLLLMGMGLVFSKEIGIKNALVLIFLVSLIALLPFAKAGTNDSSNYYITAYDIEKSSAIKFHDVNLFDDTANSTYSNLDRSIYLGEDNYTIESVRMDLTIQYPIKSITFELDHGKTKDVYLKVVETKSQQTEIIKIVQGDKFLNIQSKEYSDVVVDTSETILDSRTGGDYELYLFSVRDKTGLVIEFDSLKIASYEPSTENLKNANYSVRYPPLKFLDLEGENLVFNSIDERIFVLDENDNPRELTQDDWRSSDNNGRILQPKITLSVDVPIIQSLIMSGGDNSSSDRFLKDDEVIRVNVGLENDAYNTSLGGRLVFGAIEISTKRYIGAIHCSDALTLDENLDNYEFSFTANKVTENNCESTKVPAVLQEDKSYAFVVDFLYASTDQSLSRWGADWNKEIVRDELATSLFTLTFGDVIKNAEIVHQDYFIGSNHSNNIYLIATNDAKSSLTIDQEELIDNITGYFSNHNISVIKSAGEIQSLIERGSYGATIIDLHGDIFPIPENYLINSMKNSNLIADWEFNGEGIGKIMIDDSNYLNNGVLYNSPVYIPDSEFGISSLVFDGRNDFAKVIGTSATIYPDNNGYFIDLNGNQIKDNREIQYSTYQSAKDAMPKGLYNLETQQIHISSKLYDYPSRSESLIASYGYNVSESKGWALTVDSQGMLSYKYGNGSEYFWINSSTPIKTAEANYIDVYITEDKIELGLNDKIQNSSLQVEISYDNLSELYVAGGLEEFDNSNIGLDRFFIADKIISRNGISEPTEEDYAQARNWAERIGRWISENNINMITLTSEPLSAVSNTDSTWENKVMKLEPSGMEYILEQFSIPVTDPSKVSQGDLKWVNGDNSSNSSSLNSLNPLGTSLATETIMKSGDSSAVELYHIGKGSITVSSIDISSPYFIEESLDFVTKLIEKTMHDTPELVFLLAPASECDSLQEKYTDAFKIYGNFKFNCLSSSEQLYTLVSSGISESMIINHFSDSFPIHSDFIVGSAPVMETWGLYTFEEEEIFTLEISDELVNHPNSTSVNLSFQTSSNDIIESYIWNYDLTQEEMATQPDFVNYWQPEKNSMLLTAAGLASVINQESAHFTAIAASDLVVISSKSSSYSPFDISISSNNTDAITFKDNRDEARPRDSSINRNDAISENPGWDLAPKFGQNSIDLNTDESKLVIPGYMPEQGNFAIDFWIKMNSRPLEAKNLAEWQIGNVVDNFSLSIETTGELQICYSQNSNVCENVALLEENDWHSITILSNQINDANDSSKISIHVDRSPTAVLEAKNVNLDWHTTGVVNFTFNGYGGGYSLDNLHLSEYRTMEDILSGEIDYTEYFKDWEYFIGQNSNTMISTNHSDFEKLNVTNSSIYTDINSKMSFTEPICVNSNKVSLTVDCPEGVLVHGLPKQLPGVKPICISHNKLNSTYNFYKGTEICSSQLLGTNTYHVFYVLNDDWNEDISVNDAPMPSVKYCIETNNSILKNPTNNCAGISFYSMPNAYNKSGLNSIFASSLPLLSKGITPNNYEEISVPALEENIAEFIYDNYLLNLSNTTQFMLDINYSSSDGNGYISPTGLDWLYPVSSKSMSNDGAFLETGIIPIQSGNLVVANHIDFGNAAVLGLWASKQSKVQLHVFGENIDEETIEDSVDEAMSFGYVHQTYSVGSKGLMSSIEGIYSHKADGKLIMMNKSSNLVIPNNWLSDVDLNDELSLGITSDITYDVSNGLPIYGVKLSEYKYSTCEKNSAVSAEIKLYSELPIDTIKTLVENKNMQGDLNVSFVGTSSACGNSAQTQFYSSPVLSISTTGKTDNETVGKEYSLQFQIPANREVGAWYLQITSKASYSQYRVKITDFVVEGVDLFDEFVSNQSELVEFDETEFTNLNGVINPPLPENYNRGYDDDLTTIDSSQHGYGIEETAEKFRNWISRNGHHLILSMDQQTDQKPFSSISYFIGGVEYNHYINESGWNSFALASLDSLDIEITNLSEEMYWKQHHSLADEFIVSSLPILRPGGKYWSLDVHNEHVHNLASVINENANPDSDEQYESSIRSLVSLGRGGVIFVGDGDLYSAMSFGIDYTFEQKRITQSLGIFSKGETVTIEIDISTEGSHADLHAMYLLVIKGHDSQAENIRIADSLDLITESNTTLEKIYLSWMIDSDEMVGGYDLEIQAIDTKLNRLISKWGDNSDEIISIEVKSFVFILDVVVPTVSGAFDDVLIEIELINEMYVSNLVDVSLVFTHSITGAIYWTTESTQRCQARQRCTATVRWDAVSHNYEGQIREIGLYEGRALAQDHVSRFQITSFDADGKAKLDKRNVILDNEDFLMDISAELEIVLPLDGGDWLVRFSLNEPWKFYKAGSIIRKTDASQEFQLKKLGMLNTTVGKDITMRFVSGGDSPNYLIYTERTSNTLRTNYTDSSIQNYLHHVNKFVKDGRDYSITTNGIDRFSTISIQNEPYFGLGSIKENDATGAQFDRNSRTVKMDGQGKSKSVNMAAWTTMINVSIDGYYQFIWETDNGGNSDNYYMGVINKTFWNPNINSTDTKEFSQDVSQDDVLYFSQSTGNQSNYYLGIGTYVLAIGIANVSSEVGSTIPGAESLDNFVAENIYFARGQKIDMNPTPPCPTVGYDKSESDSSKQTAAANGNNCNQGDGVSNTNMGPIGFATRNIPASVMAKLTDKIKIPLIGANADGGKAKFDHKFGNFGIAKVEFGWDGDIFQSNLALKMSLEGSMELDGTGIEIDYALAVEAYVSEIWFIRNCYVDVIIWECRPAGFSELGEYIGWYVDFEVEIQIPIAQYLWGEPVDIKVEEDGNNYYTLVADAFIDVDLDFSMFNNLFICGDEDAQQKYSPIYDSIDCGGGIPPDAQAVNMHLDISMGVRLVFKFYMKFEFKKVEQKLQFIKKAADKINKKASELQNSSLDKIRDYEREATQWVDKKYNDSKNKLTRSQLLKKFQAKTGSKYKIIENEAKKYDKQYKAVSHSNKVSGEAERWIQALGPAVKIDSLIPNGFVKFDFAIGIYIHFDMECPELGKSPCKFLFTIELFMEVEATAQIVLFRICVWFLGCWTPTIDLGFKMDLDKIIYTNTFGGPNNWDRDGDFGAIRFCDRSSGLGSYGNISDEITKMATNFKPGDGLSAHSHSQISIDLLGLVHLKFGIPNFNC